MFTFNRGRLVVTAMFTMLLTACGGGGSGGSSNSSSSTQPSNPEVSPARCLPDLSIYDNNTDRPVITLNGPKVERINLGDNYVDEGALATDRNGADISSSITVSGISDIHTNVAGDYLVKYEVSDGSQNHALPVYRFVRVIGNKDVVVSDRSVDMVDVPWGYIEHLPSWFGEDATQKYPMIIVNHGWSLSTRFSDSSDSLGIMGTHSIVQYLQSVNADPDLPYIILMPQRCWSDFGAQQIAILHTFVEWAKRQYPVDESRIYMTGLSAGGWATWEYIRVHPNNMAAAAPMAGGGDYYGICRAAPTPVWAFAASNDATVPYTEVLDTVERLRECNYNFSAYPKFTLFSRGGHIIDDDVFNLNYLGDGDFAHDIYDQSIFDWFLLHQLPGD